jgi:hypothetical protein
MRKRLIAANRPASPPAPAEWLRLDEVAEVEISSEDAAYPIEGALVPGQNSGWRAAVPGSQTIRLLFASPQRVRRIQIDFVETSAQRTQEYLLRWSGDGGQSFHEIVRQQWNFSPQGASAESEDHRVDLAAVTVLELIITPDLGHGPAVASMARFRLA